MKRTPPSAGFHEGEVAVQEQVGVRAQAARLRRMLDPADLDDGDARFLATQRFTLLTARDHQGRLWISPVTGAPGFVEVSDPGSVTVHAVPALGSPLRALPQEQPVGMLVIDFAARRRFRLNGWLAESGADSLRIEVDQAYGNCPQYIQRRELVDADASAITDDTLRPVGQDEISATSALHVAAATHMLTRSDREQIEGADTFFLGTTHPHRGADASHRGGPPGFVRPRGRTGLWWPDYPGNNMFNSIGNLAVDPTAALVFYDFETGRTLHLAGTAQLQTTIRGATGDDGRTGRRVELSIDRAVLGPPASLRATDTTAYPRNPPLAGDL